MTRALSTWAAGALVSLLAVAAASAGCSTSDSESAPGETDASPDAEKDTSTGADSADRDAGKDVADERRDVVIPATSFCKGLLPAPKFCDDFDDGDLADDWTSFAVFAGNVAEIDDTSFKSTPFSFHAVAKATSVAAANNALLRTTGFGTVTRAKVGFSAFLPSVTFTKGVIAIAGLDLRQSPAHYFTLYLRDGDLAAPAAILEEYVNGMATRHILASAPPAGVWTRIALDLDLVGGKATVTYDATKVLDAAPIAAVAGNEATMRIGAIIDGPADLFEARFDDVVLDY